MRKRATWARQINIKKLMLWQKMKERSREMECTRKETKIVKENKKGKKWADK